MLRLLTSLMALAVPSQGAMLDGDVPPSYSADHTAVVAIISFASLGARQTDLSAVARGRRILSTAFVRVGPDGLLTVDLRDGRALMLRDVTMGATEYCGRPAAGSDRGAKRWCGDYAQVVAARPGGSAPTPLPAPATANPLPPRR